MKLSLKWLKQFVEIPEELSGDELASLITLHTAEVDAVENPSETYKHMVIGEITELLPHPNADKLRITHVNIGDKTVKIVCGGSNLKLNQLVPVALPKSQVMWHGEGDLITLEATTIRGEDSYGMICASDEIGQGPSKNSEIMDLTHLDLPAGTPLAEALGQNDLIFDIDNKAITHRPDLWSHVGFARELAIITGGKLIPQPEIKLDIPTKGQEVKLTVENQDIIKHWTSIVIDNITIQESPEHIKNKLAAIGARPVNNIVDITNLVMYELGQPLHAYDKANLGDLNLNIRFAENSEELETLDHKKRKLTEIDPILEKSDKQPIIILGIMGGANSEVSETTTSIVLESACFDPVVIRKSSTQHALRSDASQRFEKSLDPLQCLPALKKAISLILEICPEAKIAGPITEYSFREHKELILSLDPNKVNKYIGVELPISEIKGILEQLEFKVEGENPMKVTVPSFRATKDVQTEVDLIEEVVRIYGYEKIEEVIPVLPAKSPILNFARKREHQARQILASFGLSEVLNYSFYSKQDYENSLLEEKNHLKLQNFLSEEQTHLRTSLVTNLLKITNQNLKNYKELQLFEIGRTYNEIGEFFPTEEEKIAIVVTGTKEPFFDLKGILEQFFDTFAQVKLEIKVAKETPAYLHPNKSVQIVNSENIEVGTAGIIHPLVQENFDLKKEVAYAEINLGMLTHSVSHVKNFSPIAKFPSIEFDISVILDEKTFAEQAKAAISKSSDLVVSVSLIDQYKGDNMKKSEKSLTYKIQLQSPDRTLNDKDLSQAQENCIKNLKKIGGQVRGYE